jgi:ribonuclease Z
LRFEVTILGCGSAVPTLSRSTSAQYVNVLERHLLIDCAEGTQLQLRRYKAKFQKIDHIFISHLHGDHFLGLVGLLSTFHLLGRTRPVCIYGPEKLREIIDLTLHGFNNKLNFDWKLRNLNFKNKELIFEDNLIEVHSFPLKHRIDCCGFLIQEKERERNIKKDKILEYNISLADIPDLKRGTDFTANNGDVISNAELTEDPLPARSYAYCSDTMYSDATIEAVRNVDVLYHEATFTSDLASRAKKTYHSTAKQAAEVAAKAEVGKLVVGHYSARYKDLDKFEEEISPVFSNYVLAEDGLKIKL